MLERVVAVMIAEIVTKIVFRLVKGQRLNGRIQPCQRKLKMIEQLATLRKRLL
jgi:hypothetical protein